MEGSMMIGSVGVGYTKGIGSISNDKEAGSAITVDENFSGVSVTSARSSGTVNTNRYWYIFGGGLQFAPVNNALRITGTASGWSGVGADTQNGSNGSAFNASGLSYIEFNIRGSIRAGRIKVEVYDANGNQFEHWFDVVPSGNHARVRLEGVSGQISKVQFVATPGTTLDITIDDIGFSN